MSKPKFSRNAFRRQQKKLRKEVRGHIIHPCFATDLRMQEPSDAVQTAASTAAAQTNEEYDFTGLSRDSLDEARRSSFAEDHDLDASEFAEFQKIFERFEEAQQGVGTKQEEKEHVIWDEENDNIPDEEDEKAAPRKSKKQRKRDNKLSVAELKAMARKPDLVEWTDADSSDPRLLLAIKSHRNVVPVPGHWALKREVSASLIPNGFNYYFR